MKEILKKFKAGEITGEEAEALLEKNAFDRQKIKYVDGVARLDVYREDRTGIPEVIQTECKKPEWAVKLVLEMAKEKGRAIATRVNPDLVNKIKYSVPSGYVAEAYDEAHVVVVRQDRYKVTKSGGRVGLLAAGTADIGVAEEARILAQEMGCEVIYAYDVGIAGVHQVLGPLEEMMHKDSEGSYTFTGYRCADFCRIWNRSRGYRSSFDNAAILLSGSCSSQYR